MKRTRLLRRPSADDQAVQILHLEDDQDLAELAAEFLERKRDRFDVITETDPRDGLERLDENSVDCIVSGYDMPHMDGIAVLKRIRDDYPEVPFILFTGKGSEEVASEALAKGATDYLQKGSGTEQYDLLANRIENAVEQHRARQEIQRRERRLYAFLEYSNDQLSILDENGRYQFVSPAMERLMGHDAAELLGESGYEYVHPDDRKTVKAAFERIIENPDEIHSAEYRHQHADGSWRWVESRGQNRLDDPAIDGILTNSRDITDRKEREHRLKRTQTRFRALTDNTTLIVITIDDESTIQHANDAVEDVLGYDPAELVGESLLTIMPDRFHDAHTEAISRYLQDGIRQLDWKWIELPGLHKDGYEIPLGISFGEATIEGDHRFTATIRDISERKERECEGSKRSSYSKNLYDATTDTSLNFEDKLDLLLEAGCEQFRLSYGFLTHIKTDEDHDDGGTQRIIRSHGDHELLQSGNSCSLDEAYCRKTIDTDGLLAIADAVEDGWEDDPAYRQSELGCYIGGKVIANGDLYGTLCFVDPAPRDRSFTDTEKEVVRLMSRWMSYELERRQMTTELKRQNDRLQEFAGILAHDLRNPLNVAEGRLELVREEYESNHLNLVGDALDRMDALIDDVLMLAREGESVTDPEPVSLESVVGECWQTVETAGATLDIETEQSIYADPSRLQQLLENLVRNAVEHGDEKVTITVGDLENGFYIADNGPGIPADEREDVLASGYTTSTDGTGFGLAIVREIANAHDWEITVTESGTGGARFEIIGVEASG